MKNKLHIPSLILFIILLLWCAITSLLSTFAFHISGVVVAASFIALVVSAVLLFITGGKKRLRGRIVLTAAGFVAAGCAVFFGMVCNPYSNSATFFSRPYTPPCDTVISREQALRDIEQELAVLKRIHPAFINGVPDNVQAAYDEAVGQINSRDSLTVNEFARIAQSVVSVMNDAHTTVYPRYNDVNCRFISDYAKNRTDGYKITAINGKRLYDIYGENSRLFSCETPIWAVFQLEGAANCLERLSFYGYDVREDGITLTWTSDSDEFTRDYTESDFLPYAEYMELNAQYYENRNTEFVHYEINDGYALLTLDACKYGDEYKNTLREMFTKVKENGVKSVIIDLRRNGGGNSLVADELIKYLDIDSFNTVSETQRLGVFMSPYIGGEVKNSRYNDLLYDGELYCLTSGGSFSSAMLFALYLKDNELAVIIGETPGNAANSYGDTAIFTLGNSKLEMSCSTKIFRRNVPENGDYVVPDIACDSAVALETALAFVYGE